MANRHFGKFADVWKHLVLAEVLAWERPSRYAETHAGSALYPLTRHPEHQFGAWHFHESAASTATLATSVYQSVLIKHLDADPPHYPGSAVLALDVLGDQAAYLLCDLDSESGAGLQRYAASRGIHECAVVIADGMTTTSAWLDNADTSGPSTSALIHVDPFDPFLAVSGGQSALEFAAMVVERGHSLVYWYGYSAPDDRCWALEDLSTTAPATHLWCGDIMVIDHAGAGSGGDLGLATTPGTGCGVVLANVTAHTEARCRDLGRALEAAYEVVCLPSGAFGCIQLTVQTTR